MEFWGLNRRNSTCTHFVRTNGIITDLRTGTKKNSLELDTSWIQCRDTACTGEKKPCDQHLERIEVAVLDRRSQELPRATLSSAQRYSYGKA